MHELVLSNFEVTGQSVSSDMFGANAVFSNMQNGAPGDAYAQAADVLGVQNVRFGGGQADLDPTKTNAAGQLPIDGETAINIVELQNGELRQELVNFLDWCVASSTSTNAVRATLVIPTKHLDTNAYAAFGTDIEVFATKVMQGYGDVIAAIQIGNEFWEMGETAYGAKASIAAEALSKGMLAAGVAAENQPDILVQMGTAGNAGSEFPGGSGASSFAVRNAAANNQIIDQLSDDARDAIDGVTEHYYYNRVGHDFAQQGNDVRNIDKDYEIWAAAFDKDLDLRITEWNVRTSADDQTGMVAGSTLIKQFENMIEMGVDGAHVWTLDYHSRTALTLASDGGARTDDQGRLTNSAQGAAFDLMSGALLGKELVEASFSGNMPGIEVSAYASEDEAVIYVSSRLLEQRAFTLDLAAVLQISGPILGVQVSMDPASSNGRQWERGETADSVIIEGQPYFYNEHDIDVILTDLTFADASAINLDLKPFEFVQLILDLRPDPSDSRADQTGTPDGMQEDALGADGFDFLGTDGDDLIALTTGLVTVHGGDGFDTAFMDAARTDASISFDAAGALLLTTGIDDTPVSLTEVERVNFNDATFALDAEGTAGQAYRLYQASFDRTPDEAGLGFWIKQLDKGAVTLFDVAGLFLGSAEFETAYGDNDLLGDTQFVDLLYANVLGRTPDSAGYAFWRGQQENGLTREQMLISFSESQENVANVAAAVDDGFWYV